MAKWLIKSEPSEFSYDDLAASSEGTLWDGVSNPQALSHLRAMQPGDEVLYYHTGNEKAIVGLATVLRVDATAAGGSKASKPLPMVYLVAKERLASAVSLAAIKAEPSLAEWALVKQARLSVMPVSAEAWAWVVSQGGK